MYRSFVMCDDPKGVVECRTIRKSKSRSQKMQHTLVSCKAQKSSNTTRLADKADKEEMVSEGITKEYLNPSSFQLMEVSKEAQKLNQVIGSWSKGISYDSRSKDIAKDLLKGALDLQESLIMLGKLQEASRYMAQLKKKQKQQRERRRIDALDSEGVYSHRFRDQNYRTGFQQPRLSADGFSRDCIEEYKKAARGGLARQNLLPNATIHGNVYFDKRKNVEATDVPSTSSSQSSVVQSIYNSSTNSSILESAPQKKEKGSNLIARLMGLEDIPSKPLQQAPQTQSNKEKNLSQRRSFFDIEMPKARNPHPLMQKVDPAHRAVKEILETMQFNGPLGSRSKKELKFRSHHYSSSHSKRMLIDDIPPIVLIKPCVQRLKCEEVSAPLSWEEGALNTKVMQGKMKAKEGLTSRSTDNEEGTSIARKMRVKTDLEETPIKKLSQDEGAKGYRKLPAKPEEKDIKIAFQEEGPRKANKVQRKLKAEGIPTKKLSQEHGAKDRTELVVRAEQKKIKTKPQGSSKTKAHSPVASHQQQKQELLDKEVDKVLKAVASSRKPAKREIVKPKNVSSQYPSEETSASLREPEDGSIITKNPISQQRRITPKFNVKNLTKSTTCISESKREKEKQIYQASPAKLTTDGLGGKEDDTRIDLVSNTDPVTKVTTNALAGQRSTEEDANDPQTETEEHRHDYNSSLCKVDLRTSEHENDVVPSGEIDDIISHITADGSISSGGVDDHIRHVTMNSTSFKTGTYLKESLLSCPSFISSAEELFHLNTTVPRILPTSNFHNSCLAEMKVCFDYANEFIARRSVPDSLTSHPLFPTHAIRSRICLTLEQLVEEICNGVETLRSYYENHAGNLPTDGLYATLERDMKSNGVVSGIWDLGWRNGFSMDETEQTVNEMEKLLVRELIEEAFI